MRPPRFDVRIEALALPDVSAADAHRIVGSMAGELERLIAERGVARTSSVADLDGGGFDLTPDARPEAVGAEIAAAVHRGLTR
jgi:hypothetical protein